MIQHAGDGACSGFVIKSERMSVGTGVSQPATGAKPRQSQWALVRGQVSSDVVLVTSRTTR